MGIVGAIIGIAITALANSQGSGSNKEYAEQPKPNPFRDPITWATIVIAAATVATFGVGLETYFILGGQLREMVADRRPFVGIDADDITYNTKLAFDDNGASINFDVSLRNTGKSAAINATILVSNWPPSAINISPFDSVSAEYLTRTVDCNKNAALKAPQFGASILPGGRHQWNFNLHTNRSSFAPRNNQVSAWLPICIVYRDDEGNVHGTGLLLLFTSKEGIDHFTVHGNGELSGNFITIGAGESVF